MTRIDSTATVLANRSAFQHFSFSVCIFCALFLNLPAEDVLIESQQGQFATRMHLTFYLGKKT